MICFHPFIPSSRNRWGIFGFRGFHRFSPDQVKFVWQMPEDIGRKCTVTGTEKYFKNNLVDKKNRFIFVNTNKHTRYET